MPQHGRLRSLKHAVRSAMIGSFPDLYWGWRVRRRGWEEPELALLEALIDPDRMAVDVGANFGMYTQRLVDLSRRCIAFEANPRLAAMLRRGYRARIDVHQVALSDSEGTARLRVPDLDTGYASIEARNRLDGHPLENVREIEVPMRRLDDFDAGDVGFIKVDVEGHEEAVLRGALATLERCQPNLLLELEERHNAGCVRRVIELLDGHGYQCTALQARRLRPVDATMVLPTDTRDPDYIRNFIFVPRKRSSTFVDLQALAERCS